MRRPWLARENSTAHPDFNRRLIPPAALAIHLCIIQEISPGRILEGPAAGFVGCLSLANLLGRFVWSSASDRLGRKPTFFIFLVAGAASYALLPTLGGLESPMPFVVVSCFIISMYGGGFATMPAYLKDLFGAVEVGAILGRLLTAWSTAAIVGPSLVMYVRKYQLRAGTPSSDAYSTTLYLMSGLLTHGTLANVSVKKIDVASCPAEPPSRFGNNTSITTASDETEAAPMRADERVHGRIPATARLFAAWLIVGLPLAWGVVQVAKKAAALW